MLSTLGGWFTSRLAVRTPPAPPLNLVEWKHVATMGRDHYVKVVTLGHLFPFGHKAVKVAITERKFNADEPGRPAYLLKRSSSRCSSRRAPSAPAPCGPTTGTHRGSRTSIAGST